MKSSIIFRCGPGAEMRTETETLPQRARLSYETERLERRRAMDGSKIGTYKILKKSLKFKKSGNIYYAKKLALWFVIVNN